MTPYTAVMFDGSNAAEITGWIVDLGASNVNVTAANDDATPIAIFHFDHGASRYRALMPVGSWLARCATEPGFEYVTECAMAERWAASA